MSSARRTREQRRTAAAVDIVVAQIATEKQRPTADAVIVAHSGPKREQKMMGVRLLSE